MTIDTACSASLVALDVACKYIQTGEINTAIVGASHLYLRSVPYPSAVVTIADRSLF